MQPDPKHLRRILTNTQSIASVGVSSNTMRDSYWIVHYLQFQGYTIYPVNPTADEILGVQAYPDLASLPETPDLVQIFRRPEDVPPVVEEAIARGAKTVWMQEGIFNHEAAQMAHEAGLDVVMGICLRSAHQVLIGDQRGWRQRVENDKSWQAYLRGG